MPRQRLEVTTTPEVVTEVKLAPKAKTMLNERLEEYGRMDAQEKAAKERKDAIKKEIDWLFAKEKQGQALVDGAALEGNKMVWVFGSQTTLDEKLLCELTGITPAQIAEAKVTKEKKPYLKITLKGDKDQE